jgi:hypothetical protein
LCTSTRKWNYLTPLAALSRDADPLPTGSGFFHAKKSAAGQRAEALSRSPTLCFARSDGGTRTLNGRSSPEQGPERRKDNAMIAVALVAWFAVVGLVLIARVDYRRPLVTR